MRVGLHILPVLLLGLLSAASAREVVRQDREVVVSQDGTGDHRTIQAALDAIPASDTGSVTIFIRKGVYREKLFLRRPRVTLVGEDRDSTRIVYPELRRHWTAAHGGSDWGAATVNIDSCADDITMANVTILNNFGSVYGDHDHQFAIRGFGTRTILLGCTVIADGGDTVSLWDAETGMYYHADCSFEGWVDYVCPRGWCYIRDSQFFGHNRPSASFWHDGSRNRSQKFVITDSFIDGVSDFPLGRNHLDGQFFFIRCQFSANMADRQFYRPPSSKHPWQWGARHYFWGCHRTCGDLPWFADNIDRADPAPQIGDITALWTFDGRWNPEAAMPSLLPYAILPVPLNADARVNAQRIVLRWTPARHAQRQQVVLTPGAGPAREIDGMERQMVLEGLAPHTTYTWRVDTFTMADTVQGKAWTFTTE
jgi:pectinesterase